MKTINRVIGTILFISASLATSVASAQQLESVYESPSLQMLFEYWSSSEEEFHYYEALDQMDLFHQLQCEPIESSQVAQPLSAYLPPGKDQLIHNALLDLQQILGHEGLQVCVHREHQDGVTLEEIIFESERNQLALFFARAEN